MESSGKTAWLSIMTNLSLVGIKTAMAFFSGSLAITADAIHSLTDVVSSTIILLGIKISERPARGFPYGLYKVDNLVAMVTSVLILFAGYEIIKGVFFAPPRHLPTHISLSIAGIVFTILIFGLPLAEDEKNISEHFGELPFFRLVRVQHEKGEIVEFGQNYHPGSQCENINERNVALI